MSYVTTLAHLLHLAHLLGWSNHHQIFDERTRSAMYTLSRINAPTTLVPSSVLSHAPHSPSPAASHSQCHLSSLDSSPCWDSVAADLVPLSDPSEAANGEVGWPELGCMLHHAGWDPPKLCTWPPLPGPMRPCQPPHRRHQAPGRALRAPGWLAERAAGLPFSLLIGRAADGEALIDNGRTWTLCSRRRGRSGCAYSTARRSRTRSAGPFTTRSTRIVSFPISLRLALGSRMDLTSCSLALLCRRRISRTSDANRRVVRPRAGPSLVFAHLDLPFCCCWGENSQVTYLHLVMISLFCWDRLLLSCTEPA